MDTSTLAIEVNGISKSYDKVKALDHVSLEVQRGEIYGLIGPDGAGKTTLFKILVTLLNADEGNAKVDGLDVVADYRKVRARVGYMPGKFSLYPDLTIEENMEFFATLFGVTVEQNYDLVAPIYKQIEPFKKRRAGRLSGGMKQKLALSCALSTSHRCCFSMSQQLVLMLCHEASFGTCCTTCASKAYRFSFPLPIWTRQVAATASLCAIQDAYLTSTRHSTW